MMDSHSGKLVWEEQRSSFDKNLALGKSPKDIAMAVSGLAGNLIKKFFPTTLSEELSEQTQKAVRWSMARLPGPANGSRRSNDSGVAVTPKSSGFSHSESTTTE